MNEDVPPKYLCRYRRDHRVQLNRLPIRLALLPRSGELSPDGSGRPGNHSRPNAALYPTERTENQPNSSPKRPTTLSSTSGSKTSTPSSLSKLVTPYSLMPHGVIRSNHERSVFTLRAKPWEVIRPEENFTPMAAILFPLTHTPVYSRCRPASIP